MRLKNIDTSTLDGKIKVMQLAKEGRKVASRGRGGKCWAWEAGHILWAWDLVVYDIIEEPAEIWVVWNDTSNRLALYSGSEGEARATAERWTRGSEHKYSAKRFIEAQG